MSGLVKMVFGGGNAVGDAATAANINALQAQGQLKEYGNQALGFLAPFAAAGAGVLPQLTDTVAEGFGGLPLEQFQADPGYRFALNEGLDAIQSRGGVADSPFGGNVMRAMTDYASGLASQQYGQAYDRAFQRWDTEVARLMQLAGLGANVAGQQAGVAAGTGQSLADVLMNLSGQRMAGAQTETSAGAGLLGAIFS